MKKRPMTIVIKNAKRGSFAWWHEKRHAWQEREHAALSKFVVFDEWLKLFAFVSVVFQYWFLTGFCVTALFLLNFLLEFDADWFALKKTGKWKSFLRLEAVT